jgi:hypothetical protein
MKKRLFEVAVTRKVDGEDELFIAPTHVMATNEASATVKTGVLVHIKDAECDLDDCTILVRLFQ